MYPAGQPQDGNNPCLSIRSASRQAEVQNSDSQTGKMNGKECQHTVSPVAHQPPFRQIPRSPEHTNLPAKPLSSGNREVHFLERLSGRQPEYRRATSQRQTESSLSVQQKTGGQPGNEAPSSSGNKSVGPLMFSAEHRQGNDSVCEEMIKYSLIMGFYNELKDKSECSESIAGQDHWLVQKLRDCFASKKINEGSVFQGSYRPDGPDRIKLEFGPTSRVTLATPQPEGKNVFSSIFSGEEKKSTTFPGAICIKRGDLYDRKLFDKILKKVQERKSPGDDGSELDFFVRFRRHLPLDQKILTKPGYRFVFGRGEEPQSYVSDALRLSGGREERLYIEFQIPFTKLVLPDLDEIFDETKEYPLTCNEFHKNNDHAKSINNEANRKIIRSKTTIQIRNMEQSSPEKNAFTEDFMGEGIAQRVCGNGVYPSTVIKFVPMPMNSVVEGTIVLNTLNVMQTLIRKIMNSALPVKKNTLKFCISPVLYLMVVDRKVIEETYGNLSSDELNNHDDKSGTHFLRLPGLTKRIHSHSESEQFHEVVNISFEAELTLEDESNELVIGSIFPSEGRQCQKIEVDHSSVHQISKMGKVIWIAGMQRKYEKKQMVEYILRDPNENVAIKIEIIKGILDVIDIFDEFNEEVEMEGGSQIKCIIDANFGNFAFDRVGHRLIFLDVAPATSTLNGQLLPGNQFMVPWAGSRQQFVYKLSTDPQMTKLFLLIMITKDLRNLEERSCLYKELNVRDENLRRRVSELDHVVGIISNQLVENDKFMRWCDSSLLGFIKATVSPDMFDGDAKNEFHAKALNCFQRYMNNESSCNASVLKTKDLTVSDAIKLMRVLTDVALEFLAGVKKDAKDMSFDSVKKVELISKGIVKNRILDGFEIVNLVKDMVRCNIQHFLPESSGKSDGFYEVVLQWFRFQCSGKADFRERCGFLSGSVEMLKGYISGSEFGVVGEPDSEYVKRIVSLPLFMEKMVKLLQVKIDLLLIEPFSGDKKQVRVVLYKWGIASDGSYEIVLEEYSGVGALQNLMAEAKPETLILVNHQVNNLYSMGDVGDYHWSSVSFGEGESKQPFTFSPELPLKYEQESTDIYEKAVFEKIVLALKRLYILRGSKAEFEQEKSNISDDEFLARIIPWVPESCMVLRVVDGEQACALIKMNLSSSFMFRFNPLLRGYTDMIFSEPGWDQCSRIYMIMCFPKAGRYVRWMLRVVTQDDQEISYMNFRGPFSLADLKEDIVTSAQDSASQLDFMFIDGGYGYSSAHFFLHKVPEITVQSGYCDDFFEDIEKAHPKGPADQNVDSKDFYDGNKERDDTDNLTSLELRQRFYRLDSQEISS